jgi:hypothetical protein
MKKTAIAFLSISALALSLASCHYGENEAKETIERNEQYKTEKADYSINRAGDEAPKAETTVAPADSTK